MKKIILTAVLAVSSLCASAQVWMGGSIGFKSTTLDATDKSTTAFTFAPVVGYTLSDAWDIALEIAYTDNGDVYDGESFKNSFSIAPFARYNFAKSGNLSFFVDGGFAVGNKEYLSGTDHNFFQIGLRPGVKYQASKNVAFDAKLGYVGFYNESDVKSKVGLNIDNNNLTLGMTWSF
ncbi:MAG: porin family protein [Bacteroidaceae bacterium]|nr:porin family protein [Bacteroidaceae bacterium]